MLKKFEMTRTGKAVTRAAAVYDRQLKIEVGRVVGSIQKRVGNGGS